MGDLPSPTCSDCLAYEGQGVDSTGGPTGRCRFRPELGLLPPTYPYCPKFQIRKSREGYVQVPKAKLVAGKPRARTVTAPPQVNRASLLRPTTGNTEGEIDMDRDGLKQVLREILEEEAMYGFVEMAGKWHGGTLVLKPADDSLQPKEIPIDSLFRKIVSVRDKLRVLESKINAHSKLDDHDRIELQQYVSKAYGSLTTLNVLFADKNDHFSSK